VTTSCYRFDLRSGVDAAVHRQVRTVEERRLRTGDERYQRRDLVGASIPIKRNGLNRLDEIAFSR
jgi:hypothetical protein